MRRLILVAALAVAGCGGDDDGGEETIDASSSIDGGGNSDGGGDEADAAGNGGTQGVNQFCETLENGGPYCMTDLECCDDHVCRYTGDCPGGSMYVPCDCSADCQSGICCDVGGEMDTFCTKRSACDDYGGEEDLMCN